MRIPLNLKSDTDRKVCIIGNLNMDLIIRDVPRLPVWGQEVFGSNYLLTSSGQSAYSAFALSKYDVPVSLIANVGNDVYGKKILSDLGNRGIDTSDVETAEQGKTGITLAIGREDGERAFVTDPSSLAEFNLGMVNRHVDTALAASFVCIVGSFMLPGFSFRDTAFLCEGFQESGIPTMLDTGWDPDNWQKETVAEVRNCLKYIDYFIPNMDEAEALTGEKTPGEAAKKFLSDGCGRVIIKLGAEGSFFSGDGQEFQVAPFRTEVHDAVGAGDVFNAGFIYGMLQEWQPEAAMIFGSATSSLYISRLSDRFPGLKETAALADSNEKYDFKEIAG